MRRLLQNDGDSICMEVVVITLMVLFLLWGLVWSVNKEA